LTPRLLLPLAFLLLSGCRAPKYARFESPAKDYSVSVPWGWAAAVEGSGSDFSQATFVGPFDADFLLGQPSLSVRWYGRWRPRRLADGRVELFSDAEDFLRQTLRDVYGPGSELLGPDGKPVDAPVEITLKASGLKALYFAVLSPAEVPEKSHWGVSRGDDGRVRVLRKHAYALVPMSAGFYVLCYPATSRGYARYEDRFRALLGSFQPEPSR
jgi:hypothetical protein